MVAQPALEPLRRWDPERIGPYALLGRLGAGAMGQVFLGRSTAGRLVAVKTIKIEFAEEAGFRARAGGRPRCRAGLPPRRGARAAQAGCFAGGGTAPCSPWPAVLGRPSPWWRPARCWR
jgi:hypothetical protein